MLCKWALNSSSGAESAPRICTSRYSSSVRTSMISGFLPALTSSTSSSTEINDGVTLSGSDCWANCGYFDGSACRLRGRREQPAKRASDCKKIYAGCRVRFMGCLPAILVLAVLRQGIQALGTSVALAVDHPGGVSSLSLLRCTPRSAGDLGPAEATLDIRERGARSCRTVSFCSVQCGHQEAP